MVRIPDSEPRQLIAGDSWQWNVRLPGFPANTWTLTYHFQGPGAVAPIVAEPAAGDRYQVRVPAATTAPYEPGTYRWAASVSDGTDRHTVRTGTLQVVTNLETAEPARSHAEECLSVINAALEGRLTKDLQTFQIAGRAVVHIPISELRRLQAQYRREVWRERNPGRLGPTAYVRFTLPS